MNKLRVLNLLVGGGVGGVETLSLSALSYSKLDNHYIVLFKPGEISDEMNDKGYPVDILDTSIHRYFIDAWRVAQKCKKEKYDAIVINGYNPMMVLCCIFMYWCCRDIPMILHVHSNPIDWRRKTLFCAQMIARRSKKIICISDNALESVKERIGFKDKLVRIYNGVDTNAFSPKKRASAADVLRIIYVGRLEKVKGIQNILKGLSELKEIKYHFNIVGDGSYRNNLEQLTEKLNISGRVSFLGTRRDIPELLCHSDVFVHLPDCEEGFGITVIEAMAAGKIVIVNDHGALPEIVTDGVNGFVVRDGKRTFTETVAEIYDDLSKENSLLLLEQIESNAYSRAKDFSIQKYAEALDCLIGSVV